VPFQLKLIILNHCQVAEQATSAAGPAGGSFLTQLSSSETVITSFSTGPGGAREAAGGIPGFLLFDTQISQLLSHTQCSSPLFLRLFLRCAHYSVRRGFSLWAIWDDWMCAEGVTSLLPRILNTFAAGFNKTRESSQKDCDRTIAAGGLPALRVLYPYHPAFQASKITSESQQTESLIALDFRKEIDSADESNTGLGEN